MGTRKRKPDGCDEAGFFSFYFKNNKTSNTMYERKRKQR